MKIDGFEAFYTQKPQEETPNKFKLELMEKMKEKLKTMMDNKQTVPKELMNKKVKILSMDQESVVAPRFYCSSQIRPYDGYMTSSNGTFEFARIERPFTYCLPEINVYKT
jgi:hypothetical protein